jgi:hypothetical protein
MNQLAFPQVDPVLNEFNLNYKKDRGMTLRDYFAAKAMQNFADQIGSQSDQEWFDQIAKGAYRMADAMLKARGE